MKVKQPYDEPRIVPWLGGRLIAPGEVVRIPDEDLASYLEAGWTAADADTKKAAAALHEAREKEAAKTDPPTAPAAEATKEKS